MRARTTSPVPIGLGVTWFRDPSPRVAIIAKIGFVIDLAAPGGPRLDLSTTEPPMVPAIDLVPRKARVDVLVTGDAQAAMPSPTIPIEIAVGTTFRKRAGAVATGGVPSMRAPLRGLGAVPPAMAISPPRTPKEATFSDGWIDIAQEGLQVAAVDQQLFEALIYGTALSLFNLSPGGGLVLLRTPSFTPYALLVEGARLTGAHRVPMRCDTVHVDASLGTVALTFRGEVEASRFGSPPEAVIGLLSGRGQPSVTDLEAALASGASRDMLAFTETETVRSKASTLLTTQRLKASTLPFNRPASASAAPPPPAPPPPPTPTAIVGTSPATRPPPPTMPPPPLDPRPASIAPGGRPTRAPAETLLDPLAEASLARRDDALPFVRSSATRRLIREDASPGAGGTGPLAAPIVLGGWRLESVLEHRSDRVVHAAVHGALGIRGRVSILDRRFATDVEHTRQFRQQAELRLRVVHPGVVPMLDRGETIDGVPYVVDAIPQGEALDALLRAGRFPAPSGEADRIFAGVAETLGALHAAGLVHASLTPQAIFVDGARVTLGPAVALGEARRVHAPLGAADVDPSLASPETLRGAWAEVDARADVWSLAALYVLLMTGSPVPRTAAWTGLSGAIADTMTARVLEAALAEPLALRPADALQLAKALAAVRPVLADALTRPPRDDEDEDGPPTLDPRGTLPLISDGTVLLGGPGKARPAASVAPESDEDDERATVPPLPPAPPTPDARGGETAFGVTSPAAGALPFKAPPSSNTTVRALTTAEPSFDFGDDTHEPETERPPPLDLDEPTNDGLPRNDTATFDAIPDSARPAMLGPVPRAAALPFAGGPAPAPRASSRGGTPWDAVGGTSEPGTLPPAPPSSAPARGDTMPPPMVGDLSMVDVPRAVDAGALARSFGMGREGERPPLVDASSGRSAGTSPPPGVAPAVELDPKLIARVLAAPLDSRAAMRAGFGVSSIAWELGLDGWVKAVDGELAENRTESLARLLSALHDHALVRRLHAR